MIPKGWKEFRLEDIAEISGGTTPSKQNQDYWGGDIFWATPTDITSLKTGQNYIENTRERITDLGLKSSSLKLLPKLSVLMTSRASIGFCAINLVPITTNQGFANFIPKQNTSAQFLVYLLRFNSHKFKSLASGSTFLEINKSTLKGFKCVVPPLHEQKRIAEILTSVDDAIQVTEKVIEQTKKVKQGLLQELLTRGIGHTKFKKTEIGEIPESWEVAKFGKVLDVVSGKGFKAAEYVEEGIKLLRIDNVSWGEVTWETKAHLPFSYSKDYPKLVLKENDIVLALNRPITQGKLKISKIGSRDLPLILYQRVGRIEIKSSALINLFTYHLLCSYLKEFIESSKVGSDQPFINISDLRKLLLPLPPIEEQRKIAQIFDDLDRELLLFKRALEVYINIKSGLMQDLLTGRVRVGSVA